MSILGALYSAVSGLTASSNALGIISDNISNSNTVGYKETSTNFSTLVTQSSGATTLYSPGGVTSAPFYNVDQQGVMQSTNSPTDIALSGHGFFVVNVSPGGAPVAARFLSPARVTSRSTPPAISSTAQAFTSKVSD